MPLANSTNQPRLAMTTKEETFYNSDEGKQELKRGRALICEIGIHSWTVTRPVEINYGWQPHGMEPPHVVSEKCVHCGAER